jgi:hypothetical protein
VTDAPAPADWPAPTTIRVEFTPPELYAVTTAGAAHRPPLTPGEFVRLAALRRAGYPVGELRSREAAVALAAIGMALAALVIGCVASGVVQAVALCALAGCVGVVFGSRWRVRRRQVVLRRCVEAVGSRRD